MPASSSPLSSTKNFSSWLRGNTDKAGGILITLIALLFFYFFLPLYGPMLAKSVFGWMEDAWNGETNYEHGYLVPVMMILMIASVRKDLAKIETKPDARGLLLIVIGALFYVAAYRTLQARVAVGSFPFVLLGACWCFWGWEMAKKLAYPIFFIGLAIPLPSFQQSTVPLQVMATNGAQWISGVFGTPTIIQGTEIKPVSGAWQSLEVAGGCSGIRSLMALIMISATWAFLARDLSLWKRGILLLAAVPLAVIGNMLRVGSICIMADHAGYEFAAGTWHDWSGLFLFYPISLALLFLTHSLLKGEMPFFSKRKRKVVVRSSSQA